MSNIMDFLGGGGTDTVNGVVLDGTGGYALSVSGNYDRTKWVEAYNSTASFLTTDSWDQLANVPSARRLHTAIHYTDGTNDYMVMYGGHNGPYLNDTWLYNITTDSWTQLADGPSARGYHTAIHYTDGTNDYMVIYGGIDSSPYINETWLYNITTDSWTQLANGPSARAEHSAIHYTDGTNDYMVMYGGHNSSASRNDTWLYNITTDSWTQLADGPSARSYHSAIHYTDGTNDYMVVSGGIVSSYLNETWLYNITTDSWAQLANGPSARRLHTAIHYTDGTNDYMVMYGGLNGPYLNDTWLYNITTDSWTQLADGPSARGYHTAIHYTDGTNDYMVMSGGLNGSYLKDTWLYNITTNLALANAKVIIPKRI